MVWNRGSTLIETLVASVILTSGLVTVASIFSTTTAVNFRNQQRTSATLLVYDKMEELRMTGSPSGGSLDPNSPAAGFMEYVRFGADGEMIVGTSDTQPAYLRLWQVQTSTNPTITVTVFAGIGKGTPLELARATGPW